MNPRGKPYSAVMLICLVFLCTPFQSVQGQDEICESLQELLREHGSAIKAYLSPFANVCFEVTPAPSAGHSNEPIMAEHGHGRKDVSVELNFTPGIYHLQLEKPRYAHLTRTMSISFKDIVKIPADCFPSLGSGIGFPSLVRIDEDCRIYATLQASVYSWSSIKSWEVSIKELESLSSHALPAIDWAEYGRGGKFALVDIGFSPGIYRFNRNEPRDGNWGWFRFDDIVSIPTDCFGRLGLDFPSQLQISKECHIYAILDVTVLEGYEDTSWELSINKLD